MNRSYQYRSLLGLSFSVSLSMVAMAIADEKDKPPVPPRYVEAQEALAADDFSKAREALQALAKEPNPELSGFAAQAAAAQNLEAMRKEFLPLSNYVISKMALQKGHLVAFCPMFGKEGGSWVQKGGELANPYYGASMLRCGTVKKREK